MDWGKREKQEDASPSCLATHLPTSSPPPPSPCFQGQRRCTEKKGHKGNKRVGALTLVEEWQLLAAW